MRFYIVDAFTDTVLCGNPAGVVILPDGVDFPSDDLMTRTAAELRYSETAFIKRINAAEFNIRYFTPTAEVDLCGHATIASFTALSRGGYIDGGSYINHTRAGDLCISVSGGAVMMDMAEAKAYTAITDTAELEALYGIMGLKYADQHAKGLRLMPQIISTGLPDMMLPVADRSELAAIAPDFAAMADISRRHGIVGVHAFTLDAENGTLCRARNFAPLFGIDEEAATGTANGALAYYGYLNGFVKPGDTCRVIQGEAMGRPSAVMITLDRDAQGKVHIRVGGSGAILASGEIFI